MKKNGATYKVTEELNSGEIFRGHVFLGFTTERGRRRSENRYIARRLRCPVTKRVEIEVLGPICSGF